ncbi:MAG: hypothetical protein ACD_46C00533G0004 [uncultured bacterium]|nr:MAG: hypothetical protein ACD_46C00533G0004 [uncultured bacterium]
MVISNRVKKLIAFICTGICTTTIYAAPPPAPTASELYLKQIADNTYKTLAAINNLPTYMGNLFMLASSWLTQDPASTNDPTSMILKTQQSFGGIGNEYIKNINEQNQQVPNVMAAVLGVPPGLFSSSSVTQAPILSVLPYVNDLSYTSMLGMPPTKGGMNPFNYVIFSSGSAINHVIPDPNWQGKDEDKRRYSNFFNTMVAIQSFNTYAMSHLFANLKNGNQLTKAQNNLIMQASDPNWLASIGTEELGKVLRHILLFESQNYVLMTQLVQMQRDLLTAQLMGNTLMMSSPTESLMLARAQGVQPTGA